MGRFDEGTDIRMKKTTGLAWRLISSFISCAMVATLVSAPALAYAVDAVASDADAAQGEQAEQTEQADTSERIYDSIQLDAAEGAGEPAEAAGKPASSEAQAQEAPATEQASAADVDVLSAKVELGGAVQAAIAYNGMSFIITDEAAKTAALVGLSAGATLSGELQIPSQVASGASTYAVTAIEKCAGGGQR